MIGWENPDLVDGRLLVCGTHARQIDELWQKRWGIGTAHRKREPAVPKNFEAIAHEIAALRDRLQKLESKQERGLGTVFHPLKGKAERVEEVDGGV